MEVDAAESVERADGGVNKHGDNVLIAVDDRPISDYAIQFYLKSLHRPGNRVFLVHITPFHSDHPSFPGAQYTKRNRPEEEQAANTLLDVHMRILKEEGVDCEAKHEYGATAPSICTAATHVKADYIVVGCRGKGKMEEVIKGGVAYHLFHHSNVPVVVARNKALVQRQRSSNK